MGQRRRSAWVFQAEQQVQRPRDGNALGGIARIREKLERGEPEAETSSERPRGRPVRPWQPLTPREGKPREGCKQRPTRHGILRLRGENNMLGERVWRRKAGEATATTKSFTGGSDRRGEVEMVKSGQIWETV